MFASDTKIGLLQGEKNSPVSPLLFQSTFFSKTSFWRWRQA